MANHVIRAFRTKWNLSREDLASKLGVSVMTVYRWEEKKARPHKVLLEKLHKIMKGYETVKK